VFVRKRSLLSVKGNHHFPYFRLNKVFYTFAFRFYFFPKYRQYSKKLHKKETNALVKKVSLSTLSPKQNKYFTHLRFDFIFHRSTTSTPQKSNQNNLEETRFLLHLS
jgi:hypothetical protein